MVQIKSQKRLAADIMKCGERRVRFMVDATGLKDIQGAGSRAAIRSLIHQGVIIKNPVQASSRGRIRERMAAKKLGRHTGAGKRRGTREARMPSKTMWIERQRVLRRLLRSYRESEKIDKHLYRELYQQSKGGLYRNKRVLVEHIISEKAERIRLAALEEQAEARRAKSKALRDHRIAHARAKREKIAAGTF
ncbi:ribosomal protein L19/L19e [Kipferlia bialata]|uniref:Ribosomal protein L19/L19e n=1 Tax=Kipferlia bialata TaxID=797122 RepID=A0A391NR80_9EUKA|nr:ribosomal protein L19/L19e [Kipferlia bialata]|eukprot:g5098.t1